MSIKFTPLPNAPQDYSVSEESVFRRSVENSLISAYSEINNAVNSNEGQSSLASKRDSFVCSSSPKPTIVNPAYSPALINTLDGGVFLKVNSYESDYLLRFSATTTIFGIRGGAPRQRITLWFDSPGYVVTLAHGVFSLLLLKDNTNFASDVSANYQFSNITLCKTFGGRYSGGSAATNFGDTWIEIARMERM